MFRSHSVRGTAPWSDEGEVAVKYALRLEDHFGGRLEVHWKVRWKPNPTAITHRLNPTTLNGTPVLTRRF
jgi:hypothetical protein